VIRVAGWRAQTCGRCDRCADAKPNRQLLHMCIRRLHARPATGREWVLRLDWTGRGPNDGPACGPEVGSTSESRANGPLVVAGASLRGRRTNAARADRWPIVRNMQPSIGPDTRSHAAWGCVRRPPEEMCWAPSTSIGAHRVAGPVAPRARAEWVGGASSARALPGKQHADRGRFPSAAVPADGGVVAPLPFPWDAVMGDGGDGGGDGCGDGRGG